MRRKIISKNENEETNHKKRKWRNEGIQSPSLSDSSLSSSISCSAAWFSAGWRGAPRRREACCRLAALGSRVLHLVSWLLFWSSRPAHTCSSSKPSMMRSLRVWARRGAEIKQRETPGFSSYDTWKESSLLRNWCFWKIPSEWLITHHSQPPQGGQLSSLSYCSVPFWSLELGWIFSEILLTIFGLKRLKFLINKLKLLL